MTKKTKEENQMKEKKVTTKKINKNVEAAAIDSKKETEKKVSSRSTKPSKKAATAKASHTTKTTKKIESKGKTISKTNQKKAKKPEIVEYYDLPYRYNQTIVKVLAQTPTNLFIYWDISDEDRNKYIETYGENFFETTKPILVVHNETMNYTFEVEINDFANSWYLEVKDSKCNYHIELGRKKMEQTNSNLKEEYISITSSNQIESPNNRILFSNKEHMVYFQNTKTHKKYGKSVSHFSFLQNIGKFESISEFYQTIYKTTDLNSPRNPSSSDNCDN